MLDAVGPAEGGDFHVDILPAVSLKEEGQVIVVATVEEFLRRVVAVGVRTQAAEEVCEVYADDFHAGLPVADDELCVLRGFVVVEDAGGHEGGVGDAAHDGRCARAGIVSCGSRNGRVDVAVGRVPCAVGGIEHGEGFVDVVVVADGCVAVDDAEIEVSHVDVSGEFDVAEGDVDLLRVAGQIDGVARDLLELDFHRTRRHAVPEGVEGHAGILDGIEAIGVGAGGMVEIHAEGGDVIARGRFADALLGTGGEEGVGIALLVGQNDILIAAYGEVEIHRVALHLEGGHFVDLVLLGLLDEFALLIVDVYTHATHMVGEHVGPLQVSVVAEPEVDPLLTGRERIVFDQSAGGGQAGEQDEDEELA